MLSRLMLGSLRKQPTFGDATACFPSKWRLKKKHRNSILITRHYQDLGSASDWSCRVRNLIQPIRSTTQIWVLTRHSSVWNFCACFSGFIGFHLERKAVVASPNVGWFLGLHVRSPWHSWIVNSTLWIPDSSYWDSRFLSMKLGFRIPWALLLIPKPSFPNLAIKKFPGILVPDYLTWGDKRAVVSDSSREC